MRDGKNVKTNKLQEQGPIGTRTGLIFTYILTY